jgi:hypothetical protein
VSSHHKTPLAPAAALSASLPQPPRTESGLRHGQAGSLPIWVHRVEIDQATGMLTVQLGVSAGEAFAPVPGLRLFPGQAAGRCGR